MKKQIFRIKALIRIHANIGLLAYNNSFLSSLLLSPEFVLSIFTKGVYVKDEIRVKTFLCLETLCTIMPDKQRKSPKTLIDVKLS